MKRKAARQIARPKKRVARTVPRLMPVSRQVHHFKRNFATSIIVGNVAYTPYQAFTTIQLDQVVNASEFANLYDQYKINYVIQKYYMRVDPSAQSASTAVYPRIFMVRDLDSSTLLSQTEMRERSNLQIRVLTPHKPVTIKYKPNCLTEAYRGPTTTSYSPKWGQWLDMATQDIKHFGHAWNIDNFNNTNYSLEVETTLYFSCKNTR